MTLILAVMTGVSLLWFIRAVDPDAANESFKARVPLYGAKLEFEGTESKEKGTNVGKEWDYRSYVSGKMAPGDPPQYAIWSFPELPAALTKRDKARCEFNFDVYRTTKGQENRGVFCTFRFETRNWDRSLEKEEQYKVEMRKERESNPGEPEFSIANRLAKKHGYYELPAKEVVNFHTLFVDVPPGLIENALEDKSGSPTGKSASADAKPPLRVRVECISRTQFLGMAKYDLYFRLDNPESGGDQWLFGLNFFKGAGGLWLRLCLVIAVAVSLSTYLTGIISFLTTLALYGAGMSREFIETLSEGKVVGGGPAEAFMRLVTRETLVSELEKTATLQVATGYDVLFKWFVRRVLNMIPDVDRFDFADRIREGFDVSGGQLSLNFLLLVGYALPWAVLAYYLMKSREVAAS
jgi:hypothetical protein